MFEYDGRAWFLSATLRSPDPDLALGFGASVGASGGRLLVGATTPSGAGAAWLYDGIGWTPVARFESDVPNDEYGSAVAVSGNRAIVGAPGAGADSTGLAFTYAFTGSQWVSTGSLASARSRPNERFGTSVDVEGRRFVVGAPYPEPYASEFGAVYLYLDQTAVAAEDEPEETAHRVSGPFPNPASANGALVSVALAQPERLTIEVFDALGRQVQTLARDEQVATTWGGTVDTQVLTAGLYVVRVVGDTFVESVRLVVAR